MPEQGAPREGSGDQLAVWTSLSFGCRGSPGFCGPVASAGPTSDFRFLLHLAQFPGTVSRHRQLSGEVQYGGTSPLFTADPAAVRCDVCLGGAEHPSSSQQSGLGVLTKPRQLRTLIHKDSHRIWDRDAGAGVGGGKESCGSRTAAPLTCVVPPRKACSRDTGPRGGPTPALAQGRACRGGRAGWLAECAVAGRVCGPGAGERAPSAWHTAATRHML